MAGARHGRRQELELPGAHATGPPGCTADAVQALGRTLAAFHHNRHHDLDYTGPDGTKPELMADRSEIWVALSGEGGRRCG